MLLYNSLNGECADSRYLKSKHFHCISVVAANTMGCKDSSAHYKATIFIIMSQRAEDK